MRSKTRKFQEEREQLAAIGGKAWRWLRNAVLVLFAAIILVQFALQNETIRMWLTSAARWEGTSLG